MDHNSTAIRQSEPFNAQLLECEAPGLSQAVEAARATLALTGDKWQAYEAFKRALPEQGSASYEQAIRGICQELGL